MRILQTVSKLKTKHFIKIKKNWKTKKKLDTVHQNIWSMFDLDEFIVNEKDSMEDRFIKELDGSKELNVTQFAWTWAVRRLFYNHSCNIAAKKVVENDALFILNSEPREIKI